VKTKLRKTYNLLIRIAIIIISYGFIYYEIFEKRDLNKLIDVFIRQWQTDYFFIVSIIVFLLIILNWGIEAKKWQFLVRKIEDISLADSYKAVLTGVSVSAFTPNRIGEYFGRIFILKKATRWEGIFVTIVGSLSQLMTTLICGYIGILFFLPSYININNFFDVDLTWAVYFLSIFSVLFILMIYFNISLVSHIIEKYFSKNWVKFKSYVKVLQKYSSIELLKVLSYSMMRYLVFNLQLYLLLRILGVNVPILHSLMLTSVMYYALATIPTIALTELGVRGSVIIFLFEIYFSKTAQYTEEIGLAVFTASSTLWLINIILPALVGTIFVYRLKFFRK
jgi:uncharacterized membrane protein YbhN (UPF0104 family)